jgi:hypothetical protein
MSCTNRFPEQSSLIEREFSADFFAENFLKNDETKSLYLRERDDRVCVRCAIVSRVDTEEKDNDF